MITRHVTCIHCGQSFQQPFNPDIEHSAKERGLIAEAEQLRTAGQAWRCKALDMTATLQAAAGCLEDIYTARTTSHIPAMALRALNDVRAALARAKTSLNPDPTSPPNTP
jgi:hypothetical protein